MDEHRCEDEDEADDRLEQANCGCCAEVTDCSERSEDVGIDHVCCGEERAVVADDRVDGGEVAEEDSADAEHDEDPHCGNEQWRCDGQCHARPTRPIKRSGLVDVFGN